MLPSQIVDLTQSLRAAMNAVGVDEEICAQTAVVLDRPRQAGHGDLASNLALQLAKSLRQPPRTAAAALLAALLRIDAGRLVDRGEVAGPGFINLWLTAHSKRRVLEQVLAQGARFGDQPLRPAEKVLLEFVSANPTGPLHVGHGRQAALGDVLGNLLASQGWQVSREFYYNDAGVQINNLALSVQARCRAIGPDDPAFPTEGYRGEYIGEIARDFMAGAVLTLDGQRHVTASSKSDDLDSIRAYAVAYLRREQDLDLKAFGVRFDHYYLESSLYRDGQVAQTVARLIETGKTYQQDQALWLKSTDYADDKDRVMRKSDGSYTYFVPDVAYHVTKWARGYRKAINIQGSDHHGTIARVRAGLQALGEAIPPDYPEYLLHKMVRVVRDGQEVKISKRAGSYVTLRDLIEWCGNGDEIRGRDAVRYFLISRKADTEFTFDIDLALSRSDENPVYYIQYAHARICSIMGAGQAQPIAEARPADGGASMAAPLASGATVASEQRLALLQSPGEFALLARLAAFPTLLAQAATEMAPHQLAYYLRDLAADFHAYYGADRILVDDRMLREARLLLLLAVRTILRRGLELIGVSAPERM